MDDIDKAQLRLEGKCFECGRPIADHHFQNWRGVYECPGNADISVIVDPGTFEKLIVTRTFDSKGSNRSQVTFSKEFTEDFFDTPTLFRENVAPIIRENHLGYINDESLWRFYKEYKRDDRHL